MNPHIEKIKKLRLFLLKQTEGLTPEQLNTIPQGFNNNIIWNMAHVVAAQQSICYIRCGLPTAIEEQHLSSYMPGTKPGNAVSKTEIVAVKERLIFSIDRMHEDYKTNLFSSYTHSARIKQVYDVDVNTIDDAIDFILYHEGFHVGCIMMLKHLV